MYRRYVYLKNGSEQPTLEHIKLYLNSRDKPEILCGKDMKPLMTAESEFVERKNHIKFIDSCPECLEQFKQSNHPEAVAYRRMFEIAEVSNG